MVSLRHFPAWCSAAVFQFIILAAPFSDRFRTIAKSFAAFANASLFYVLATCVHVHELQTANWLQRPVGGACNGGKTTHNRKFTRKWGGGHNSEAARYTQKS